MTRIDLLGTMREAEPFISLQHVSIRLRDQILFENLSWEILSDQHWAVIGPNGSGKSTLMRALSGALPVAGGKIVYHFAERDDHLAPDKKIAYVNFESQRRVLASDAFYQERWNIGLEQDALSVAGYLSKPSINGINAFQIAETQPDENSVRQCEVLEQLELSKLLGKSIVQLSNGERRKVLIARALLRNPRLLILDNPFAGLDEGFRKRFAENLDRVMRTETRVVLVGTNRDAVPRGITHVLSIRADRVVAQGTRQKFVGAALVAAQSGPGETQPQSLPQPDSSRQILVQMRNVDVSYNGAPILHQINWTVRANEHWALLGPNGAGKTTLLSLILADNPQAYANDITLFGKLRGSGESIWDIKKNIGWVAPELQLYYPRGATCLDVACSGWFDSVGLYRECSGAQQAIAEKWLEKFGMSARAADTFEHVSEGEQRLALLARALVKDPGLLLLDEPCQGLDPENRDRVLWALAQVSPRTIIYVTHRADEMPASITHVLRLDAGRIVNPQKEHA